MLSESQSTSCPLQPGTSSAIVKCFKTWYWAVCTCPLMLINSEGWEMTRRNVPKKARKDIRYERNTASHVSQRKTIHLSQRIRNVFSWCPSGISFLFTADLTMFLELLTMLRKQLVHKNDAPQAKCTFSRRPKRRQSQYIYRTLSAAETATNQYVRIWS